MSFKMEITMEKDIWTVEITGKARKQKRALPKIIDQSFSLLVSDLKKNGPEAKKWPNFGILVGKKGFYHCHLNKKHPRYVAVWKVSNMEIKLIEVRYVGTHEKADYRRIN